jgi:NADH dehydrogenase
LLKDGSEIATHTLFWAAGVRAAPLADALQVARGRGGRIVVRPDLALPDHPEVFVVGDMAYLEQDGAPLPMLAPVAMQQGRYVGRAIIQRERGQPLPPFRYRDKGAMAIIGRNSAIARWRGLQFSGFLAWLAWLGLHLYYLVGFRNQLLAIIDWGYQYIMFDRKVRLITGEGKDGCTGDTL